MASHTYVLLIAPTHVLDVSVADHLPPPLLLALCHRRLCRLCLPICSFLSLYFCPFLWCSRARLCVFFYLETC